MDIIVLPACSITARTSLKSRLISPGTVTRSAMPWTPWRSMLSARREGILDGHVGTGHLMQALVGNDDQRIHVLAQRRESLLGYSLPAGALKGERQASLPPR